MLKVGKYSSFPMGHWKVDVFLSCFPSEMNGNCLVWEICCLWQSQCHKQHQTTNILDLFGDGF